MTDLLLALGMVLAVEGFIYAAFPGAMKRMMAMAQSVPESYLRSGGIAVLATGVMCVWLVRG